MKSAAETFSPESWSSPNGIVTPEATDFPLALSSAQGVAAGVLHDGDLRQRRQVADLVHQHVRDRWRRRLRDGRVLGVVEVRVVEADGERQRRLGQLAAEVKRQLDPRVVGRRHREAPRVDLRRRPRREEQLVELLVRRSRLTELEVDARRGGGVHLELHGVTVPLLQADVLLAELRVPTVLALVLHLHAELAVRDGGPPLGPIAELAVPGERARPLREALVVKEVVPLERRRRGGWIDRPAGVRTHGRRRRRRVLAGTDCEGEKDHEQLRRAPGEDSHGNDPYPHPPTARNRFPWRRRLAPGGAL